MEFAVPARHPRLLLQNDGFLEIRRHADSELGRLLAAKIRNDAAQLLALAPPAADWRDDSLRMLSRSRQTLYRLNTLLVAWILTGEDRYALRATAELTAACHYPDWNPPHFLDVAELALGVALAYDWLYEDLSPEVRRLAERSLLEKALAPSWLEPGNTFRQMGFGDWLHDPGNNRYLINQTALIAAAIAIRDVYPDQTRRVLERAVAGLPQSLRMNFCTKGSYPESGMYWGYACSFLALAIHELRQAFASDFGLADVPGVRQTLDFIRAVKGTSGLFFNYGDGFSHMNDDKPFAIVALAQVLGRRDMIDDDVHRFFQQYCAMTALPPSLRQSWGIRKDHGIPAARTIPLLLLFDLHRATGSTSGRGPLSYRSGDDSIYPVASMRSGWDRQAIFFAIGFGPSLRSHGHSDCGSFVCDIGALRLFRDNGSEDYAARDAHAAAANDAAPLFRVSHLGHNQLLLNDKQPGLRGAGRLLSRTDSALELDLSAIYAEDATRVTRRAELLPGRGLRLTDTVAGAAGKTVTWRACTEATNIEPLDAATLRLHLTRNVVESELGSPPVPPPLRVRVRSSMTGEPWRVVPADALRGGSWECANPGVSVISRTMGIPEDGYLVVVTEAIIEPASI